MNLSTMFSIGWADVGKGLVLAVIAAVITYLYQALAVPGFSFATFDWSALGTVASLAGLSYLIKNFFSDSQGKFVGVVG